MAARARDGASRSSAPRPRWRARRLGRRSAVLVMVVATASLAVTGYACSLAAIDGVAAIRGPAGGHRPPPAKGVVAGISSFVGSSAFAAALSSASSTSGGAAARDASPAAASRDAQECLPASATCVDLTGRLPWRPDDDPAGDGPVLPSPGSGARG